MKFKINLLFVIFIVLLSSLCLAPEGDPDFLQEDPSTWTYDNIINYYDSNPAAAVGLLADHKKEIHSNPNVRLAVKELMSSDPFFLADSDSYAVADEYFSGQSKEENGQLAGDSFETRATFGNLVEIKHDLNGDFSEGTIDYYDSEKGEISLNGNKLGVDQFKKRGEGQKSGVKKVKSTETGLIITEETTDDEGNIVYKEVNFDTKDAAISRDTDFDGKAIYSYDQNNGPLGAFYLGEGDSFSLNVKGNDIKISGSLKGDFAFKSPVKLKVAGKEVLLFDNFAPSFEVGEGGSLEISSKGKFKGTNAKLRFNDPEEKKTYVLKGDFSGFGKNLALHSQQDGTQSTLTSINENDGTAHQLSTRNNHVFFYRGKKPMGMDYVFDDSDPNGYSWNYDQDGSEVIFGKGQGYYATGEADGEFKDLISDQHSVDLFGGITASVFTDGYRESVTKGFATVTTDGLSRDLNHKDVSLKQSYSFGEASFNEVSCEGCTEKDNEKGPIYTEYLKITGRPIMGTSVTKTVYDPNTDEMVDKEFVYAGESFEYGIPVPFSVCGDGLCPSFDKNNLAELQSLMDEDVYFKSDQPSVTSFKSITGEDANLALIGSTLGYVVTDNSGDEKKNIVNSEINFGFTENFGSEIIVVEDSEVKGFVDFVGSDFKDILILEESEQRQYLIDKVRENGWDDPKTAQFIRDNFGIDIYTIENDNDYNYANLLLTQFSDAQRLVKERQELSTLGLELDNDGNCLDTSCNDKMKQLVDSNDLKSLDILKRVQQYKSASLTFHSNSLNVETVVRDSNGLDNENLFEGMDRIDSRLAELDSLGNNLQSQIGFKETVVDSESDVAKELYKEAKKIGAKRKEQEFYIGARSDEISKANSEFNSLLGNGEHYDISEIDLDHELFEDCDADCRKSSTPPGSNLLHSISSTTFIPDTTLSMSTALFAPGAGKAWLLYQEKLKYDRAREGYREHSLELSELDLESQRLVSQSSNPLTAAGVLTRVGMSEEAIPLLTGYLTTALPGSKSAGVSKIKTAEDLAKLLQGASKEEFEALANKFSYFHAAKSSEEFESGDYSNGAKSLQAAAKFVTEKEGSAANTVKRQSKWWTGGGKIIHDKLTEAGNQLAQMHFEQRVSDNADEGISGLSRQVVGGSLNIAMGILEDFFVEGPSSILTLTPAESEAYLVDPLGDKVREEKVTYYQNQFENLAILNEEFRKGTPLEEAHIPGVTHVGDEMTTWFGGTFGLGDYTPEDIRAAELIDKYNKGIGDMNTGQLSSALRGLNSKMADQWFEDNPSAGRYEVKEKYVKPIVLVAGLVAPFVPKFGAIAKFFTAGRTPKVLRLLNGLEKGLVLEAEANALLNLKNAKFILKDLKQGYKANRAAELVELSRSETFIKRAQDVLQKLGKTNPEYEAYRAGVASVKETVKYLEEVEKVIISMSRGVGSSKTAALVEAGDDAVAAGLISPKKLDKLVSAKTALAAKEAKKTEQAARLLKTIEDKIALNVQKLGSTDDAILIEALTGETEALVAGAAEIAPIVEASERTTAVFKPALVAEIETEQVNVVDDVVEANGKAAAVLESPIEELVPFTPSPHNSWNPNAVGLNPELRAIPHVEEFRPVVINSRYDPRTKSFIVQTEKNLYIITEEGKGYTVVSESMGGGFTPEGVPNFLLVTDESSQIHHSLTSRLKLQIESPAVLSESDSYNLFLNTLSRRGEAIPFGANPALDGDFVNAFGSQKGYLGATSKAVAENPRVAKLHKMAEESGHPVNFEGKLTPSIDSRGALHYDYTEGVVRPRLFTSEDEVIEFAQKGYGYTGNNVDEARSLVANDMAKRAVAHEAGHHVWQKVLTPAQREKWKKIVIDSMDRPGFGDLYVRNLDVLGYTEAEIAEELFSQRLHKLLIGKGEHRIDPAFLKREIDFFKNDFVILEDVDEIVQVGKNAFEVPVPKPVVSIVDDVAEVIPFKSPGVVNTPKVIGTEGLEDTIPKILLGPESAEVVPLSLEAGNLKRISPNNVLDDISQRSQSIRERTSIRPPPIKKVVLDDTSRKGFIKSVERHYEQELGLPENSLSIKAPETPPKSGNEVFIVSQVDETGKKKALLVKVFVREEKGAVAGAEAFREVEALSLLQEKGLNVPGVVDIASVNYPGKPNMVMVATEIAPGRGVGNTIEDISKLVGQERAAALTKLESQMENVGSELARFHNSAPPSEVSTAFASDIKKIKRHILERQEAGHIDQSTAKRLLDAVDGQAKRIESAGGVSSKLTHGDFHGGNVYLDGDKVTFIDVESTLESLSKGNSHAFGTPGNDYGRFMESLYQPVGAKSNLAPNEIRQLENAFLSSYSKKSGIPLKELEETINLYKAKTSLVVIKYADTNAAREIAFKRLQNLLLGEKQIATPSIEVNSALINKELVPPGQY